MEKVTGGWTMDRILFSDTAKKVFEIAIEHRRKTLVLKGDALGAERFNSNGSILARLESMFDEKEFMACPGPCIDKALQDAAESDWWYHYEKDYGTDEQECDIESDENE